MSTDLESQLKGKYDELASGQISYSDFTTWFEQQQWPSAQDTNRLFEAVELTGAHIKLHADQSEDLNREQLTKIGDYLHGRTDTKPAILGDEGMSQDALRHGFDDLHKEHKY